MLILGEGGAGKTSLLRRLYQPEQPLPTEDETTKGIAIYRHDFTLKNGQPFRLNVWDFGGQEIYHATHQFFLTRRSLYLLLDDTRKDHKSVSDPGFKYWLDLIELFGGHSPVLMFQNEKGGRSKEIDLAGINGQFDNVKECYRGNLEQENAADQLREGIELFASQLTHIGDELPVAWIKIRAAIEERAVQVPHISIQEYLDLYSRFLPFDQTKALHLSRYLHDLGVFLHFQDEDDSLLSRIVILQNPWATEAVYRILDDETVKAKRGRFDRADCKRAWGDASYAAMHPELLALMQRFELCYELSASKPQTWLAPQLLAAAKPTQLHDWNRFDDLVLRYRYDFLPKGTLSRLMVRLHRFVLQPACASINCVLFERETTELLAELLPSGNDIALRVRGPESKALLSVVAAELDAINDGLPGLAEKVNKLIPCNCEQCRNAPEPEFFSEKLLLRRKQARRNKIECQCSFTEVDGLALLDGIKIAEFPGWAMPEPSAPPLRIIKIFLSSNPELLDERDAFELYFRQQNDHYRQQGVYLEIVRWENLFSAVSATRMQDEYNQALRECDIFLSLFFTKAGQFADEEFDAAHAQFKATGLPYIFTYFKDAGINTGSAPAADLKSLWAFQDKLIALGHNPGQYSDIEHLKRQFNDQLKKLLVSPSNT